MPRGCGGARLASAAARCGLRPQGIDPPAYAPVVLAHGPATSVAQCAAQRVELRHASEDARRLCWQYTRRTTTIQARCPDLCRRCRSRLHVAFSCWRCGILPSVLGSPHERFSASPGEGSVSRRAGPILGVHRSRRGPSRARAIERRSGIERARSRVPSLTSFAGVSYDNNNAVPIHVGFRVQSQLF
jgi:hypothetical protein